MTLKQEEALEKMEETFENKLRRELDISHELREEAEEMQEKHKKDLLIINVTHQGRYAALENKMEDAVAQLTREKADLHKSKEESEHYADEFLFETELNYDQDLEGEFLRTRELEKELRGKIHDAMLDARMHKRRYDQLIEKLEREKKEEHDHAGQKEELRKRIKELEDECLQVRIPSIFHL